MNVTRLRSRTTLTFCHNGCRSHSGQRKSATHLVWLIGRHTPLCGPCAKAWGAAWDAAVRNWEPGEAKAAA